MIQTDILPFASIKGYPACTHPLSFVLTMKTASIIAVIASIISVSFGQSEGKFFFNNAVKILKQQMIVVPTHAQEVVK